MRQHGHGVVITGMVAALMLSGCYRVKKWDVAEGRETIYSKDPSKEKSKSAHPIRGIIKVDLAAPKHMACVLKSIDGSEGFDGKKICQMEAINGKDLKDAWKKMYEEAEGHKLKAGFIAMNVGEVLQSELKASLEQYFYAADVTLVESGQSDQKVTAEDDPSATKEVQDLVSPDNHRVIAALSAAEHSKEGGPKPAFTDKAGVHIPFTINSVPVFLYVPTTSTDRVNPESFAEALRVSAADLAKKLIEYQDEAARSAKANKKPPRSISVVF